jgi:hypothetical protein
MTHDTQVKSKQRYISYFYLWRDRFDSIDQDDRTTALYMIIVRVKIFAILHHRY